jgi:hypothetical protein
MTKLIGKVADLHHSPELPGDPMTDQQVANRRLSTHEKLIVQLVPRTDQKATFTDEGCQTAQTVGTDVEVILESNRLPIKVKMVKEGLSIEDFDQMVDQIDETHPELLVGKVPFTVPVGMTDNMKGCSRHFG